MKRTAGFMLVELLIAMLMVIILAAISVAVVLAVSRVAQRATLRLAATRTRTTMSLLLSHELGDAAVPDLALPSPTRARFSRAIGQDFLCADSASAVYLPTDSWIGSRAPEANRDQVELLADPDSAVWVSLEIVTLDSRSCPGSSRPAWRLGVPAHSPGALVGRIEEPVEMSVYRSGVDDWFGLSPFPVTSSVQPFAGPLPRGTTTWGVAGGRFTISLQLAGVPFSSLVTPLATIP